MQSWFPCHTAVANPEYLEIMDRVCKLYGLAEEEITAGGKQRYPSESVE